MSTATVDPWARYKASARRTTLIAIGFACLIPVVFGATRILVVPLVIGGAALVWWGIGEWIGSRARWKRSSGLMIILISLPLTGGGVGLLGSMIVFVGSWRMLGVYERDTLPQAVVDPRAGWRFGTQAIAVIGTLYYGGWVLQSLDLVPFLLIITGVLVGLSVTLIVLPYLATFTALDDRWLFAGACFLVVLVYLGFTALPHLLPGAYEAPVIYRDYEVRVQLWTIVTGVFAGLWIYVYQRLPSHFHFWLRSGHAREFGFYLYPRGWSRAKRSQSTATRFRRSVRAATIAPGPTWVEAIRATEMVIAASVRLSSLGHAPPPEVALSDATINAANRESTAQLQELVELLKRGDSQAFVAWKSRFEQQRSNTEVVTAMAAIAHAAKATHVAPPGQLLSQLRLIDRIAERDRLSSELKLSPTES